MRATLLAGIALVALASACSREPAAPADIAAARTPIVTISADQAVSPVPPWRVPAVQVTDDNVKEIKAQATYFMRLIEDDRKAGNAEPKK